MQFQKIDPNKLSANPWNTNQLTPEAKLKLEESIQLLGMFKPVVVRELEDGQLQILGGEHRAEIAIELGITEIPIVNLGKITEDNAKRIGLVDNARYGYDDSALLGELLKELGNPTDLASFLPFNIKEFDRMLAVAEIDLDDIGFEDDDAPAIETIAKAPKTHTLIRFRVPIADQPMVETVIKTIIEKQGFVDSDSMVQAGDALVWLISNLNKSNE